MSRSLKCTYGMVDGNAGLSMIKAGCGLSGRKLDVWGRSSFNKNGENTWGWLRGRFYATVLS